MSGVLLIVVGVVGLLCVLGVVGILCIFTMGIMVEKVHNM
jgi:hypothetical protein